MVRRGPNRAIQERPVEMLAEGGALLETTLPSNVRLGEVIKLEIILTNRANEKTAWEWFGHYPGCKIDVYSGTTKVPYTPRGMGELGDEIGVAMHYNTHTLEPGGVKRWEFDLNELFQFTPGKYTVKVSSEVGVETNRIHVVAEDRNLVVSP
jgi:hypothetical protein